MHKKQMSVFVSLLMVLTMSGCKDEKVIEEPKEEIIMEAEEEIDLVKLEEEYSMIVRNVNYLVNLLWSEESPTVMQILDGLNYIRENRVEPTQRLTIELNDMIDRFVSLGFDYYMTKNEETKREIEIQLYELFQDIEQKCLDIENLLNMEQL